MTEERKKSLVNNLRKLGYERNKQVRLYGADYALTSDPMIVGDRLVVIDATERKSGQTTRIRIPLTILIAASQNLAA